MWVKIGALTIKAENEKNPSEWALINKIRGWRVSKYVDIKYPNELY